MTAKASPQKFSHNLKKFSDASFLATTSQWRRELRALETEVLANEYERTLVWASTHLVYANHGQSFFYGAFNKDAHSADAIAEINYFKKGAKNSWLKVLDLHLSPQIKHDVDNGKIEIDRLASIFTGTVFGTLELTHVDHPSSILKYYGRGEGILKFFQGLSHELNTRGKVKGLKVSVEGRWLVFRKP